MPDGALGYVANEFYDRNYDILCSSTKAPHGQRKWYATKVMIEPKPDFLVEQKP